MLNVSHSKLKTRLAVKVSAVLLMVLCGLVSGCGKDLSDKEYIERAKQAQDKGDLRTSVIDLKNALRRNPDNTEGRWMLGKIYLDVGNGAAAEKELAKAKELGIAPAAVEVQLGQALLMQGLYDRVIKEITPVEGLSVRDQALIHALRGEAYLNKNKVD